MYLIYFLTSGEDTVRLQAGMEGVVPSLYLRFEQAHRSAGALRST
jgi:hypothetical protein